MNTSHNTSLKPINIRQPERYGKEYMIEYRHRIWLWNKYKIKYTINPAKYGIKRYFKEST